jgi:hypothetical protein
MIQKGEFTAAEIENQAAQDMKHTRDRFGRLIKLNAFAPGEIYSGKEMSAHISRFGDGTAKQQEEMAKAEQELQKTGLDPTTKKMVELRIQQQKTRDSLQNLVNKGVGPATTALEGFASVANRIAGIVPGTGSEVTDANKEKDKDKSGTSTSGVNASADAKQIMAAIRTHESGGNYTISSPGSTASGAYQFLDDSWKNLTKKYGIGQEYARAKMAPKDIQDAIAAKFVEEILKANNNDPKAVFNTWYTGNAAGKISKQAMAANNNLTAEQMTKQFMDIYHKLQGQPSQANDKSSSNNASTPKPETPSTTNNANQPPWLRDPAVSGADGWDGMLTGPTSGYRPNVVMHGTEDLKITPKSQMANGNETNYMETNGMLQQQTAKLDELIRILGNQQETDLGFQQLTKLDELNRAVQDQVNVSTKILQASR